MNDATQDGGPAFPESGLSGLPNGEFIQGRAGMTLRDYFAAHALQGLLAYSHCNPQTGNVTENCSVENAAKYAFQYAGAMLSARAALSPEEGKE